MKLPRWVNGYLSFYDWFRLYWVFPIGLLSNLISTLSLGFILPGWEFKYMAWEIKHDFERRKRGRTSLD